MLQSLCHHPRAKLLLEMNNCLVKIFEQRITQACIFLGKVWGPMMGPGPPRTIRFESKRMRDVPSSSLRRGFKGHFNCSRLRTAASHQPKTRASL